MIYLLLSILSSTLIVIILKFFEKFKVDTFQAIVINYWVCTFTGSFIEHYFTINNFSVFSHQSWNWIAILLGISFICLFNLMGWTAQKLGLTAVSVSNKFSLIIPVAFAFLFFKEQATLLKIIAIIVALAAVLMVTISKAEQKEKVSAWYVLLPIILFIGSGANDTLVNYAQKNLLDDTSKAAFVIWIFQTAALIGTVLLLILLITKKKQFHWRNIIGGIVLGIPNYFSMYYLVKALADSGWQSSEVFPINNVAIVAVSAIAGIILFKEKITKLQIAGMVMACVAILLLI